MSNIEIVQLLSNGYTVSEIAEKNKVSKYVLAKKIFQIRVRCGYDTVGQLIAEYLRKKLID